MAKLQTYSPRTLASEVKARGALPLEESIGIGRALALALAELHRHGLVHRDIKPSNIIFVDGAPKLVDVGLVSAASEARSFVGTEGFIPPEGPGTVRADLYSLGIVLYVMSTGLTHRDFPVPPGGLATRPDRERWLELQAVIHRACQADPKRRYGGAGAMVADLDRLSEGGSVRKRRAWERRGRIALILLACSAIVVLARMAMTGRIPSASDRPVAPVASLSPVAEVFETSGASSDEGFHRYLQAKEAMRLQSTNGYVPAIAQLEIVVNLDPGFARAWLQLANARYGLGGFCFLPPKVCKPQAREAALKALSLDGRLVDAIVLLGRLKMEYERDWEGAERDFRRAVELDPRHPEARSWLATWLSLVGRHDEAVRELQNARQAAPDLPWLARKQGVVLVCAGRSKEAEELLRESIRRDSGDGVALFELSKLLWAIGRLDESMSAETAGSLKVHGIATINQAAHEAYRRDGLPAFAKVFLDFADRRQRMLLPHGWLSPVIWADAYRHAGNLDQAFHHLERACEERDEAILDVVVHPYWRTLWNDKRFDEILSRTGLDRYLPQRMHRPNPPLSHSTGFGNVPH